MNILIITPRIPYPPFRGDKLKVYNISKQLSKKNTVTILTFYRNKKQLINTIQLKKSGINVEAIRLTIIESLFRTFISVFTDLPFQVAWFKSDKMKKRVEDKIRKGNFDIVYYHLIRSSQYLFNADNNSKPVNILDFTDAVSLYLFRFGTVEKNPLKRFLVNIERKRIEKYEKIAERFHTLFICSEIDRDFLLDKGIKANIKLLKNGIDTSYFKSEKIEYEKNRIIFTGNMPYFANYDAAIYFTKEIFPLILKRIPEANFYIVGQKPPRKIFNLQSENVIVTGFVQDIRREYLRSAVNVAPMRFGAGTLNKIIESIILGVPVVATPIAIEGLPSELKKYIFVSNDINSFADQVCEIMHNPAIREELMEEGKKVIEKLLSWEKLVKEFENYLQESIADKVE